LGTQCRPCFLAEGADLPGSFDASVIFTRRALGEMKAYIARLTEEKALQRKEFNAIRTTQVGGLRRGLGWGVVNGSEPLGGGGFFCVFGVRPS
jgi:hypothetical protein